MDAIDPMLEKRLCCANNEMDFCIGRLQSVLNLVHFYFYGDHVLLHVTGMVFKQLCLGRCCWIGKECRQESSI